MDLHRREQRSCPEKIISYTSVWSFLQMELDVQNCSSMVERPIPYSFRKDPYPPAQSRGDELDLIFGIAIDPPQHYAMVPCGRILFKK
jgi:hypothetical protein